MRIDYEPALLGWLALALTAGCSVKQEPNQPFAFQSEKLSGVIKSHPWHFENGEARSLIDSKGRFLEITLWDNPDRHPCVPPTVTNLTGRLVYVVLKPEIGETKHDFGVPANGTSASFIYREGEGFVVGVVTAGSSYIDSLSDSTVSGRLNVSAGESSRVSGWFKVTVCH